jgi:hypothetical protein
MIFSNRARRRFGQWDFESKEGRQKAEICEEEGPEARNETTILGETIQF